MKEWIEEQITGMLKLLGICAGAGVLEWFTFWLLGCD